MLIKSIWRSHKNPTLASKLLSTALRFIEINRRNVIAIGFYKLACKYIMSTFARIDRTKSNESISFY